MAKQKMYTTLQRNNNNNVVVASCSVFHVDYGFVALRF